MISMLREKVSGLEGESSRIAEVRGRESELEGVVESKEKEIAKLRAENAALARKVEQLTGLSELELRNKELEAANKELAEKFAGLEIVCVPWKVM